MPTRSPGGPTVRIVAINDVYSLENLPRLRTLVEHHRAHAPADLLLVTLAGDFVAPSILSSLDLGRGIVECLKMVGVTHAIFGNHEDDIPIDALRSRIEELGATWLSTNVAFEPPLPASQVLTVGRVRLGLVGVVMTDEAAYRRPPFGGAPMRPANVAAREEAARLVRDERCTCVVPLTHQTLQEDRLLARGSSFPVIVGGHEHVVVVERIEGVWLVKAASDAVHAAVVDLAFAAEAPPTGELDHPEVRVRIENVADYAEAPALRAVVDAHMSAVRDLEGATLLTFPPGVTLSSVGSRAKQTSLGTLLCNAVRDALGSEACLINGGGIRGARDYPAELTYGDLKTELPFENEIVVVALPGRVLRDAVTASRSHAPAESGSFLQVDDGMVVDAHDLVTAVDGAPLDLEREYRVALVHNLLLGLDRIEPLVAWARAHPQSVPSAECGRETKEIVVEAFSLALWQSLGGFDAVDTNHDGAVTEAEVLAAVKRVRARGGSPLTAQLVVGALDKNHDLAISRDEGSGKAEPNRGRSKPST